MILVQTPMISRFPKAAALRLDLKIIAIRMIVPISIAQRISILLLSSGHLEHSNLPMRVQSSIHTEHLRPEYPKDSSQSPFTFSFSTPPRQAVSIGHSQKLVEFQDDLQYPSFGYTLSPFMHTASSGQSSHSSLPASNVYFLSPSHTLHSFDYSISPTIHSRMQNSKLIKVSVATPRLLTASVKRLNFAFYPGGDTIVISSITNKPSCEVIQVVPFIEVGAIPITVA